MSNQPNFTQLLVRLIEMANKINGSALDLARLQERPGDDAEEDAQRYILDAMVSAVTPFDHSVSNPYLDGLNDHSDGPVAILARQIAYYYGAPLARIGVNGTTGLNQTIVGHVLATLRGAHTQLIIDRGCHISMIAGLVESGMEPFWIQRAFDPTQGCEKVITPQQVEEALQRVEGQAAGVVLTIPTYDGAIPDVPAIAEVCLRYRTPLGVDGAWGVGMGLFDDEAYPESPISQGASFVTLSLHKKGLAPSQVSAALFADDTMAQTYDVAAQLNDTTSPNFFLLALAQHMFLNSVGEAGRSHWARAAETKHKIERLVEYSDTGMRALDYKKLGANQSDPSHLVISLAETPVSGFALYDALAARQLDVEKATFETILLLIGPDHIGREQEIFTGLRLAFEEACKAPPKGVLPPIPPLPRTAPMTPRSSYYEAKELVPLDRCVGRIAGSIVCVYPPGSPLIVPGEVIEDAQVDFISMAAAAGGQLRGVIDLGTGPLVSVVAQPK